MRKDYVDWTWGSAAALIKLEVYETAYVRALARTSAAASEHLSASNLGWFTRSVRVR